MSRSFARWTWWQLTLLKMHLRRTAHRLLKLCGRAIPYARTPSQLDLLRLEDRVFFSATPLGDVEASEAIDVDVDLVFEDALEHPDALSDAPHLLGAPDDFTDLETTLPASRELVIIDSEVEALDDLLHDLLSYDASDREFELVVIESDGDPLTQISEALIGQSDLDAIHIVSHGQDGAIQLGGMWLTSATLEANSDRLASWNSALAADGDLLLYGCDVAANDGTQLVEALHRICHCDVAASVDPTGNTALGADWQLEYEVGAVQTEVAFSEAVLSSWSSTLAAPIADAGPTYTIQEGEDLQLDASATFDADGDDLSIKWDLDGDLGFDDAEGVSPNVTWDELIALGYNDETSFNAWVRVSDGTSVVYDAASVIIENAAPTFSVEGDSTIVADRQYTLKLSVSDPGDDSVSSWTIDWGDGNIETFIGNPSEVYHVYESTGTHHIVAAVTQVDDGTFLATELLAGSKAEDSIFRFEGSGSYLPPDFADDGTLINPSDMTIGPDGMLYVGSDANHVVKYDPITGNKIGEFVSDGDGIQRTEGIAFGPDGNLYVVSHDSHEVLRFDGTSGDLIDVFVSSDAGLNNPHGLAFGTDGNLYVSDGVNDRVMRFDGATGTSLGEFVASGSGGLDDPRGLTFGVDGYLYVASGQTDEVLRFDATDGSFDQVWISSANLDSPTHVTFGPDAFLYATNTIGDAVIRVSPDGSSIQTFLSDPTEDPADASWMPQGLVFLPQQQVTVTPSIEHVENLWIATRDAVPGPSGVNGVNTWTGDTSLVLSNLTTEPGLSSADFQTSLQLNPFVTSPDGTADIEALHFVSRDIALGTNDTVELFAGDVILATEQAESFLGSDAVALNVTAEDILVFRPDTPGNYVSGSFFVLMRSPLGSDLTSLTLVERDASVGDTIVRAGSLLVTANGSSIVHLVEIDEVGESSSGVRHDFLDLSDLGVIGNVDALDLVEQPTSIDINPLAGHLLIAFETTETIGATTIAPTDVAQITLTTTTYGTGITDGSATTFLEGADLGLDTTVESIDSLSLGDRLSPSRPTATNLDQTRSYTEGDVTVEFDDIVVSDGDTNDVITVTLQLGNPMTGALTTDTGLGETFDAATGIWTMTGSVSDVNVALADVAFRPTALNDLDTVVSVAIEDQYGLDATPGKIVLDVAPINTAPTATNTNQLWVYAEDTSVDLDDILVSDLDSFTTVTVTLTLQQPSTGTLTADSGNGETYDHVSGIWMMTGSLTDVNAALADVAFDPMEHNEVDSTITVSIVDQDGAAMTPAGLITLDVTPANDAPTNIGTLPSTLKAHEDVIATFVLKSIELADPDDGDTLTLYLRTVNGGRMLAFSSGGVVVNGQGTSTLTLSGVVDDLNTFIDVNSILYLGETDVFGTGVDRLVIGVQDTNSFGVKGTGVLLGSVDIDIAPINDAPIVADERYAATEGKVLNEPADGVLENDEDIDSPSITAVLVSGPSNGKLVLNPDGSFRYLANAGFSGTDQFTYVAHDGAAKSKEATVTIDVTLAPPPPDPDPDPDPTPDPGLTPIDDATDPILEAPPDNLADRGDAPNFAETVGYSSALDRTESEGFELTTELQVALFSSDSPRAAVVIDDISRPGTDQDLPQLFTSLRDLREDLIVLAQADSLWEELDNLSVQLEQTDDVQLLGTSSVVFTSAFTVGYVVWLLRAGQLLTGILAQMPAWHLVDPLPVLDHMDQYSDDGDDDSLQSMIEKGSAS